MSEEKKRTIRDLSRVRKQSGDLGIEIEVEGSRLPDNATIPTNFSRTWRIERDGSLRGESFEYVLVAPLSLDGVNKALDVLREAYKHCGSTVFDSVRCGVHVHVNCQEMTMKQVMTFATLYYTLEDLLLMYCTSTRRGNHFCLRAKDAEYMLYVLTENLKSGSIRTFNNDNLRYSSLNFCALPKFGSVEFRSLESPEDMSKISDWAGMLLHLKNISLTFDDPIEVITSMSSDGYEGFIDYVLGEHSKKFKDVKDINGLILNGVRNAQSLAYAIPWKTVDDVWDSPSKRKSRRREMQYVMYAPDNLPPEMDEIVVPHGVAHRFEPREIPTPLPRPGNDPDNLPDHPGPLTQVDWNALEEIIEEDEDE